MTPFQDCHAYWLLRGTYPHARLPSTRRERKAALKKTRAGVRMRGPIKRQPTNWHLDAMRMFINGVEYVRHQFWPSYR